MAREMRWLAFGDVNTNPGDDVRTYVDLARVQADALGLAAVQVYGDSEWTSRELLHALPGVIAAGTPEPEKGGDLVSIMIGSYDHAVDPGETEPRVSLSQFRDNVRAALRAVTDWKGLGRRSDGGPCLIVMTPPYCMTGAGRTGLQLSQERLTKYCAVLLELAEEFDAIPVDVNTAFGGSVRWNDDRLKRVWTERGDGLTLNSIAHNLIYPYVRGAIKACTNRAASE